MERIAPEKSYLGMNRIPVWLMVMTEPQVCPEEFQKGRAFKDKMKFT